MHKFRLRPEPRPFQVEDGDTRRTLWLRQIEALHDFADVKAGSVGGWLEQESQLSQHGRCWIYDENSLLYGDASVAEDAILTGECVLNHGARVDGNATVDASRIGHRAHITGHATVRASRISGRCFIGDVAHVSDCDILALQGLTADSEQRLRIADRASVHASRVVHQSQIYGSALVSYAFIEHRAEVYGHAIIEGNEENDVWLCDCAQVYGHARVIAGRGLDETPTLRYSTRISGNARVEGNCLFKHHVTVCDDAVLIGGPLQLDNHVDISGQARICGNVLLQDHVSVSERACIEACAGEAIQIQGDKVFNGDRHITRMPFYGIV